MTLPDERTRAVLKTRRFLLDLLSAKTTPRVPKAIRLKAYELLKHFPDYASLQLAYTKAGTEWGNPKKERD